MTILQQWLRLLILCVVTIVFVSCSGTSATSETNGESSSEGDSLGGLTSDESSTTHPVFPHDADWKEPTNHGLSALSVGIDVCLSCHDRESTLTQADKGGGAPGCKSCHTIFPHIQDWRDKTNHGQYVLNNGQTECAGECHGSDLDGGLSEVSCNKCHAVFPHRVDGSDYEIGGTALVDPLWKEKENHGRAVLTYGVSVCQACHGDDFEGGDVGVSCRKCHTVFPHRVTDDGEDDDSDMVDDDWKQMSNHGLTAIAQGKSVCQGCHGEDYTGADTGVSCYQCHSLYPHSSDWAEPANHGVTAKGNGKELCRGCHGEDLTGGDTGKSCYGCHTIFPHETAWSDIENHGVYANTYGTTECAGQCHGSDLNGGLSDISCLTGCHTVQYPHPTTWANADYQGTDSFHGYYAQGSGKTQCINCHGEDYRGGLSGISCYNCHTYYPHIEENLNSLNDNFDTDGDDTDDLWVTTGKDNLHAPTFVGLIQADNEVECTRCHGESFDREIGGVTCTNCHTLGITHTDGWSPNIGNGTAHGSFYSSNFSADSADQYCKDCHGDPVKFSDTALVGTAYNSCTPNCHGVTSRSSDQTRDTLIGSSFCYTCHWAYPHIGYTASDSEGNVIFDQAWGPTDGVQNGTETGFYWGHVFYQTRNPLFVDSSGRNYGSDPRTPDDGAEDVISNTCAGSSAGMCHYNGYRSPRNSLTNLGLCRAYCHVDDE